MKFPVQLPLLAVCIIFSAFIACDQQPTETPEKLVVATVGNREITFKQLEESFWINPRYAVRTPVRKARLSQLKYLIKERYYLLSAEEAKLDDDPVIQKRIDYIRKKETLKAYLREKFLAAVKLGDLEVLQGLAKFRKQVRVQHLFTDTREAAEQLKTRLDHGETFKSLATELYRDSTLSANGGEIGYIAFGELDPSLEQAVYSLGVGEVSEPVASSNGYHIVKVLDIREDPYKKAMSTALQIQQVSEILKNRKADARIREYLNTLAGDRKIRINNRLLDILTQEINLAMGERYNQPGIFAPPINDGELTSITSGVENVLDEPLMIFAEQVLTVRDFLDQVREMPPYHRPYLRNRKRIAQYIIDMVRRELLYQEALRAGFDRHPEVQRLSQQYIDELLAHECKKRILSQDYRELFPEKWRALSDIYDTVRQNTEVNIKENNLIHDLPDPDSLLTEAPIPVFIKGRYIW